MVVASDIMIKDHVLAAIDQELAELGSLASSEEITVLDHHLAS